MEKRDEEWRVWLGAAQILLCLTARGCFKCLLAAVGVDVDLGSNSQFGEGGVRGENAEA